MTSPAVTIAMTYDGVDIQDVEGIHLQITRGLLETATIRGVDVTVPGLDWQVPRPRRYHERRVLLAGFVRGTGPTQADRRADFRDNIDILVALFDEVGGFKDLVLTLENGDVRTLPCRTIEDGRIINEQVISEFGYLSIEMYALGEWEGIGDD